jgi:aldose sugar dehydrogenase
MHAFTRFSTAFALGWHVLAVLLLVQIPQYLRPFLPWTERVEFRAGVAASYLAVAVVLTLATRGGRRLTPRVATAAVGAAIGGLALELLFTKAEFSRIELLAALVLVSGLAATPLFLARRWQVVAVAALAAVTAALPLRARAEVPVADLGRQVVRTSFVNLAVTTHANLPGVRDSHSGGAIAPFGDGMLIATADGDLHQASAAAGSANLRLRKLTARVPMNLDAARAYIAAHGIAMRPGAMFRVADLLAQEVDGRVRLIVAHHHWNNDDACFTLRVSLLERPAAVLLATTDPGSWETIFDSHPCLPLSQKTGEAPLDHVMQSGGFMEMLDTERLLVTVGDHEFDGVNAPERYPQEPSASYGKTVLVDLASKQSSIYTLGHRSPGGLHVDEDGAIWLTEHGPQGGDELNLLSPGGNYGWPLVTYGTNYGRYGWPLSVRQNRHDGFVEPTYVWTPSIGIAEVIRVRGTQFPTWKGDLLISSLRDQSLWRLRVDRARVIFTERIPIGQRIRHVIEDRRGLLLLWTESYVNDRVRPAIVVIAPAEAGSAGSATARERGSIVFARCSGCHAVNDGKTHGLGPDLKNVVGRDIAAADGFAYSPALQGLPGAWTDARLDAFFANPAGEAPGTTMLAPGVSDADDRRALIEYLRSVR